jgi:hypothetical protein
MSELREKFEETHKSLDLSRDGNGVYISQETYIYFRGYSDHAESINTPKHETVEQWEKRTGESYPDDGPVWLTIDSELWVTGWQLMTKEYWLLYNNDEQAIVYIANHHGKPEIEE